MLNWRKVIKQMKFTTETVVAFLPDLKMKRWFFALQSQTLPEIGPPTTQSRLHVLHAPSMSVQWTSKHIETKMDLWPHCTWPRALAQRGAVSKLSTVGSKWTATVLHRWACTHIHMRKGHLVNMHMLCSFARAAMRYMECLNSQIILRVYDSPRTSSEARPTSSETECSCM